MPKLCLNCSRAIAIKRLIDEYGKVIHKCKICGIKNIKALDCTNNKLTQLFKALIRYNFSEWEYNGHWGGEAIESLFYRENPILNYDRHIDEEALEGAILTLIDNVYEDYERGVTLFAGYDDHAQPLGILQSIKSKFDSRLFKFSKELKKKNHFLLIDKAISLVEEHSSTLESFIPSGKEFFRARIGYGREGIATGGWEKEHVYQPFEGFELSAPPPFKAIQGRMNRDGVSFLYLATDMDTAIAEVRPHPGQISSVGKFVNKIKLRIADFNLLDIYDFFINDKLLDTFALLKSIDKAFSEPIPPDRLHNYTLTQLLSDALRSLKFDGIGYRSSVGKGSNLTIFDPEKFKYVKESAAVVRTEGVLYKLEKLTSMLDIDEFVELVDGKPVY